MALVVSTLGAMAPGVAMVFSATKDAHGGPFNLGEFTIRQAIYGLIGLVLMFVISRLDYRFMESFTIPFYVVSIGLLGLVMVLGITSGGAQRWLPFFNIFPIQPSELAKLSLIVVLAKVYADHERELGRVNWFIFAGLLTLIPAALVFMQPDLGTAIMLVAIFGGITIGARVGGRIIIGAVLLALPVIFVFWNYVMHDYQR